VGALSLDEPGEPGMGIARYVRLVDQPDVAEVAVTIVDEYQKSGLGTLLLHALVTVAAENGITQLQAEIMGDNYGAIRMVRRFGAYVARKGNPCLMAIDVPAAMEALRDNPYHGPLVALARGEAMAAP
jgi:ribosomal protein S18 acetylase RimI-like enzyme